MKTKRKVLPQMFDVRPVDNSGNLDLDKIERIGKTLELKKRRVIPGTGIRKDNYSTFRKLTPRENAVPKATPEQIREEINKDDPAGWKTSDKKESFNLLKPKSHKKEEVLRRKNFLKTEIFSFTCASLLILLIVSGFSFLGKGLKVKDEALAESQLAYQNLIQAKESMSGKDFSSSLAEFQEAGERFKKISDDLDDLGGILLESGRFIPFLSKATSGKYLSQAGEDISRIGILMTETLQTFDKIGNPLNSQNNDISFLEIFKQAYTNLDSINSSLSSLESNLDKVALDDIPEDNREKFSLLKSQLPEVRKFTQGLMSDGQIMLDVLGGNGPRKYLFLFQNNHEMRATGGFIGSYGILDIFNGRIRNFFVDGIFNPDGQLREKVVPPAPIQKISAAWSLHDSNWFPDFPTSAEKARWFYEKTGGPTVDGVIAMTPTVLEKLIAITGPIEMEEYGFSVDKDNFMEKIQEEVEVNYDKEANQPKKVLADLAPMILDRLFNEKDLGKMSETLKVLGESLNEKHILIYANNVNIEEELSRKGWSGEMLDTEGDYLSVINSNINGYKTDGVIEESINHKTEIQEDGSIIDEVEITRKHDGGDADYEWFNKVNADYMRVYVPKGSKLLSAEGQTREFNSPPIDYSLLGFKRDPQIEMEEQSMAIDKDSGTRIYEDSGKTVFANWVYVSPKETVTMKYRYLLPFRIDIDSAKNLADNYSLMVQKQSGSLGSRLSVEIGIPKNLRIIWRYPDQLEKDEKAGVLSTDSDLQKDRFFGLSLEPHS